MKKNDKTKEKRPRVRVLETGELGTVTDQQLIPRKGKLHRYVQVKMDKKPHLDRWYWDDQLGGTRETCRVMLEDGRSIYHLDITKDHETEEYTIGMRGDRENGCPYIHDLAMNLMRTLLIAVGCTAEDLENAKAVE